MSSDTPQRVVTYMRDGDEDFELASTTNTTATATATATQALDDAPVDVVISGDKVVSSSYGAYHHSSVSKSTSNDLKVKAEVSRARRVQVALIIVIVILVLCCVVIPVVLFTGNTGFNPFGATDNTTTSGNGDTFDGTNSGQNGGTTTLPIQASTTTSSYLDMFMTSPTTTSTIATTESSSPTSTISTTTGRTTTTTTTTPCYPDVWLSLGGLASDVGRQLAAYSSLSLPYCQVYCDSRSGCLSITFYPSSGYCILRGKQIFATDDYTPTNIYEETSTYYRSACAYETNGNCSGRADYVSAYLTPAVGAVGWLFPGQSTEYYFRVTDLTLPPTFTIETWIYPLVAADGTYFLSWAVSGNDNCLILTSSEFIQVQVWHHLVLTWDGSALYVILRVFFLR